MKGTKKTPCESGTRAKRKGGANLWLRAGCLALALMLMAGILAGCGQPAGHTDIPDPADVTPAADDDLIDISLEMVPLTEAPAMFTMPMPAATGTSVQKNAKAEIDYSNTKDGYVMIKYLVNTSKQLRVQIKGPSGVETYTYTLKPGGVFEVFPLSDGNGKYTINVLEQVDGSKYSLAATLSTEVKLNDEFAPFIRPNQYVNYKTDSDVVKKAAELVKDAKDVNAKVAAVYNYVTKNLTYDKELANTVKSGYLPDVDAVMKKGKGICFDYAAVMSAMLRSQDVPTKLVVGYAGEAYHAWINVWSAETGWLDTVIFFDGKTWTLMDPTFASSATSEKQIAELKKIIGDGKNYKAKYLY